VIDLVGNAQTTQLGFDCLTKGGKLVIVGLFGGGAPWALPLIPIKAITIQGSYVGNLRETAGTARSRPHQEDRADPGDDDAAREGQRSADRFAEGQTGRPRGADAVGLCRVMHPSVIASEAKQSIYPLCREMDCFASLAMTA
jgi:hypothetical protein